jgi:hypothetical protein
MDDGIDHTTALVRQPTMVEIVRELGEEDIALIGKVPLGSKSPALKRLTESHHLVARMMAEGEANSNISVVTGYSASRLSILRGDPAFQELIAHYREKVEKIRDEFFIDTQGRLAALRNDAIEAMHEKVLEGELPARDLKEYAEFASDRSGFGPQSKSTNLNMNVSFAEQLAVGRQKALELKAAIPAAKAAREVRLPLSGGRGNSDE